MYETTAVQETAMDTLRRMGGHATEQARRFLDRCEPEEVGRFAECETGSQFSELMDQVLDRLDKPVSVK